MDLRVRDHLTVWGFQHLLLTWLAVEAGGTRLMMESGDLVLMETGDKILLEAAAGSYPADAILDANGQPFLDVDGEYILEV